MTPGEQRVWDAAFVAAFSNGSLGMGATQLQSYDTRADVAERAVLVADAAVIALREYRKVRGVQVGAVVEDKEGA